MQRQQTNTQKGTVSYSHLHKNSAARTRSVHPLAGIQRSIGSTATQRLISSPLIQTKLQVSQPEDPLEQEADRTADKVMRMTRSGPSASPTTSGVVPTLQRVPLAVRDDDEDEEKVARESNPTADSDFPIQRKCSEGDCEENGGEVSLAAAEVEEEDQSSPLLVHRICNTCEEEQSVQPKDSVGSQSAHSKASTPHSIPSGTARNIHSLGDSGSSLPESSRAFFEPRFGVDLSNVRVHTDSRAAETAKSINAKAFTVGSNIAFGSGEYDPHSSSGKQLLAHELTHTIQQSKGTPNSHSLKDRTIQPSLEVGSRDAPEEREADSVATSVVQGSSKQACTCGGTCESCATQRKAQSSPAPMGPGHPLDNETRAAFEPRFGVDLGSIRIHNDPVSNMQARSMGAQAFTVGTDISFSAGAYRPGTAAGNQLLAHELAHATLGHSGVRRGGYGDAMIAAHIKDLQREALPKQKYAAWKAALNLTPPEPTPVQTAPTPINCGAPSMDYPQRPIIVDGVQIHSDEQFLYCQLRRRAAQKGMDELEDVFYPLVQADYAAERDFASKFEQNPTAYGDRTPRSVDELDTEFRALNLMPGLLAELNHEWTSFINEFEETAKTLARETLDRSEVEERAAAFRYGIDWKTVSVQVADCMFGDCKQDVSVAEMSEDAPDVKELQAAAALLLKRRQAVDKAKQAVKDSSENYADAVNSNSPNEIIFAHIYYGNEVSYKEKVDEYNLVYGYLAQRHPFLKVIGDLESSTSNLETFTKPGAGLAMAAILGKEIVERLSNIQKVRGGLEDRDKVNIWRLPNLVALTQIRMGAEMDALTQRWVTNQVDAEKPGMFESIALLIFNIGAILLAAPTGGASLAVAFGVNAAVAAEHVKDYMMQKALTGTSFDKAQALSQDEPSLFWLAVDIVGVAFDAAAAFKALAGTVKAVKLAKEAKDAAKVASELEKLETAARNIGGEELWLKISAHMGESASAERSALSALGLAEDEIKSLRVGAELSEKEIQAGTLSGKVSSSTGKVSRSGHIFSCASPCTWMRDKYPALLGPDVVLEGEAATLKKQFLALEENAAKAAEDVRLAESNLQNAKPAERIAANDKLAQAKNAAEVVEKNVAALDAKLAKEVTSRSTIQKLGELTAAETSKLRKLSADAISKFGELEPAVAKRLLQVAPESIEKLTALGPRGLQKLAQFEPATIEMFAKLEAESLKYVADLSGPTIEWLSKLKPSAVAKIAAAEVRSPFSLRQLVEKIGPGSTARDVEKALAKAERHRSQLEKAFEASESGDWSKISGKDRSSIGRHIGYELEEIAKATATGGRAKTVLNYELVNKRLISKLEKDGGRALITQGRLKGGDLRFDIAEINFDKKTVELIDLAPKSDAAHLAGTKLYEKELRKLLPADFKFITSEFHYVGEEEQVLEDLAEVIISN